MNAYRAPDDHLISPPDIPQPSEDQYKEAFNRLVDCFDSLADFIADNSELVTRIIQLMHSKGLPTNDKSKADDALRDKYESALSGVIDSYRMHLDRRDKLSDMSLIVMHEEIEQARQDATEAQADYYR